MSSSSSSDLQRVQQRVAKELRQLSVAPPFGVAAYTLGDNWDVLRAELTGFSKDSVYCGGVFRVTVAVPHRYPFEPPKVRFETKVYHPNIDSGGRICLDTLNMPPKGSWTPSVNIATLLTMLRQLLLNPNPSDGLETDIAAEYVRDRARFDKTAREWTQLHASGSDVIVSSSTGDGKVQHKDDEATATSSATPSTISPVSSSSSSTTYGIPHQQQLNKDMAEEDDDESDSEPEECVVISLATNNKRPPPSNEPTASSNRIAVKKAKLV